MIGLANSVSDIIDQAPASSTILVAYSGGVDSHVLLHVCSGLKGVYPNKNIKAVYIDHGLHKDSPQWRDHCEAIASSLGIEFLSEKVHAANINGDGPEQAARNARYAALALLVNSGTLLLTAQHQDDQAETLMLQLLRGAGAKGLASMPTLAAFGKGCIGRPFLSISQQEVMDYAMVNKLCWIDDPSNLDTSLDRNYLRQQVIPLIKKRWPAFAKTTSRTASHCAEATDILSSYGSTFLSGRPDEISLELFQQVKPNVCRLILREWMLLNDTRLPSEKVLNQILVLATKKIGSSGLVEWSDYQVRLFNQRFFLFKKALDMPATTPTIWPNTELTLRTSIGLLKRTPVLGFGLSRKTWMSSEVSVRYRTGGEKIRIAKGVGHRPVKKLLSERKIFPWQRQHIPLIYFGERLVAVANLWVADEFSVNKEELGFELEWLHPGARIC